MTHSDDEPALMDADALAAGLHDLVAAIDRARAMGLPVAVPDSLFRACQELVNRRLPSDPRIGRPQPAATTATDGRPSAAVTDVPLRRLLWQVMDPGETVTVGEIASRLAAVGAVWPAHKVSNALSYWVERGRLVRERKGLYRYPSTVNRERPAAEPDLPQGARPEIEARSQPVRVRRAS